MPVAQIARAIALTVPALLLLAALAFALLTASIATADHAAIRAAVSAMPDSDLGVPEDQQHRVFGFREGFFPECAALSLLIRENPSTPAEAAIRAETIVPPPEHFICAELQRALAGEASVQWFTYARYWHGATVVHRAVLSHAPYETLRWVTGAMIGLSIVALGVALLRRHGRFAALAIVSSVLLLSDSVFAAYMPILGVSVAVLLLMAAAFVTWGAPREGAAALAIAALAGAVYNFFDFLCNPAMLAMLCAWSWAAAPSREGQARDWRGAALVFGAVLGGYGAFWALKWALATGYAWTGGEIYLFNGGDMTRWTPVAGGWFPGAAMLAVVSETFDRWWKIALGVLVVGGWLFVLRRQEARGAAGRPSAAALLTPIVLGWVVIEAISGHTIAHAAITFRIVPLTIGLALASLVVLRQTAPDARSVAISSAP